MSFKVLTKLTPEEQWGFKDYLDFCKVFDAILPGLPEDTESNITTQKPFATKVGMPDYHHSGDP